MTRASAAGRRIDAPSLGEAALQEALAAFAVAPGASANGAAAAGRSQAETAPPSKTVAQILGEIAWLMTQSPRHKTIPIGDLEWLVMPALLLRQFRIFYKGEQPVGVALWALVDDLVVKRIDNGDNRLSAVQWKSGSNMRIIDVVAPFGGEAEMRGQIDKLNEIISFGTADSVKRYERACGTVTATSDNMGRAPQE